MLLFSSIFYIPYSLDMAAFNLTGQGMKRNAADGLFTKPSTLTSNLIVSAGFIQKRLFFIGIGNFFKKILDKRGAIL